MSRAGLNALNSMPAEKKRGLSAQAVEFKIGKAKG